MPILKTVFQLQEKAGSIQEMKKKSWWLWHMAFYALILFNLQKSLTIITLQQYKMRRSFCDSSGQIFFFLRIFSLQDEKKLTLGKSFLILGHKL